MSAKDLNGNDVPASNTSKVVKKLVVAVVAAIICAILFGTHVSSCLTFNKLNRQRLRNLENFGAAATLRASTRHWTYPWLIKDTEPVELIFFDHPRFQKVDWTEDQINRIVAMIKGLPQGSTVMVARKDMTNEVVSDLADRLAPMAVKRR